MDEIIFNMEAKKRFIIEECMLFSMQAGLQTRNKNFPVYNNQSNERTNNIKYQSDVSRSLKLAIFEFLHEYLTEIKDDGMHDEIHYHRIEELANHLTVNFKPVLHNGRFRIGVSQKIINLFLKYMWAMGEIPEPCHCPIDGIIKDKIQLKMPAIGLVDWTKLDHIMEYRKYIIMISQAEVSGDLSIAQWELLNWGRR